MWLVTRPDEERTLKEYQEDLIWDEDGMAVLPEDDDSEYLDRKHGREF